MSKTMMLQPLDEIRLLGIERYPKGIRWDTSEKKFLVDVGVLTISGTKSSQVSLINKFRDVLDKYLSSCTKLDDHAYAQECLRKLPQIRDGEVLHGPRTHEQGLFRVPEIRACGIRKNDHVIIFDDVFEDRVRAMPAIDFSGGSPVCPSTRPLQLLFPEIVSDQDVKAKKKYLVKELVWRGFLRNATLPPEHTIVPINHQQTDLRSRNLVLLPGSAKSFKAASNFRIPEEVEFPDRFFPGGVSLTTDGTTNSKHSPWTLSYKSKTMDKKRKILCSPDNLAKNLRDVYDIFARDNPNFVSDNARFQQLAAEYLALF
jgi:hypothetical protein